MFLNNFCNFIIIQVIQITKLCRCNKSRACQSCAIEWWNFRFYVRFCCGFCVGVRPFNRDLLVYTR